MVRSASTPTSILWKRRRRRITNAQSAIALGEGMESACEITTTWREFAAWEELVHLCCTMISHTLYRSLLRFTRSCVGLLGVASGNIVLTDICPACCVLVTWRVFAVGVTVDEQRVSRVYWCDLMTFGLQRRATPSHPPSSGLVWRRSGLWSSCQTEISILRLHCSTHNSCPAAPSLTCPSSRLELPGLNLLSVRA